MSFIIWNFGISSYVHNSHSMQTQMQSQDMIFSLELTSENIFIFLPHRVRHLCYGPS